MSGKTKTNLKNKLKKIKILLTDVDGVLTDEGMYYTEEGLTMKKFNVKDGMGAHLLHDEGFILGLISSDNSLIAKTRGERLLFDYTIVGTYAKLEAAKKICSERNLTLENVAFIGDDVNDLELLASVGFSAAPKNSVQKVKNLVDYVCVKKGGEGAYREIAEMILAANKKSNVSRRV